MLSCQTRWVKLSHLDLVLLVHLSAVFRMSAAHQAGKTKVMGFSMTVGHLEPWSRLCLYLQYMKGLNLCRLFISDFSNGGKAKIICYNILDKESTATLFPLQASLSPVSGVRYKMHMMLTARKQFSCLQVIAH